MLFHYERKIYKRLKIYCSSTPVSDIYDEVVVGAIGVTWVLAVV